MPKSALSKESLNDLLEEVQGLSAGHHREKIYPYDTVGGLVACGDEAWGPTIVTVPVDGITDDYGWDGGSALSYAVVGFSLIGVAVPAVQCTLQHLRVVKASLQVLDEDSGSGQAGEEKRIHVPLTGGFLVDDYVWVVDDTLVGGEICKIAAIVTDDYLEAAVNLTGDYDIDTENAKVYLVRRLTTNGEYRSLWTDFSVSSAKDLVFHPIHTHRQMASGDGMISRGRSVEAGEPTVRVTVVYDDS